MIKSLFEPKELTHPFPYKKGSVGWRCPSNIALIKYWGKYDYQRPKNPSLSITLNEAFTETNIDYEIKNKRVNTPTIEFIFEGKPEKEFKKRILAVLEKQIGIFPFLRSLNMTIKSTNSFPHSSGIASSASSMGALALCLCTIEQQLFPDINGEENFKKKASYISRTMSGSACRSIFGNMAIWGKLDSMNHSSELFAIPFREFHPVYKNIHDDILIINANKKKVSSSEGHRLMENNPYAESRYKQAEKNFEELTTHLHTGEIWKFGKIVEDEALNLHALMMCSDPSFILMEPQTLKAIERIRKFRIENNIPVFFTLDAGPNIHILYPDYVKNEVQKFISSGLINLSPNHQIISDFMGKGPVLLHKIIRKS